jgi:hypothetical protein
MLVQRTKTDGRRRFPKHVKLSLYLRVSKNKLIKAMRTCFQVLGDSKIMIKNCEKL